MQQLRPNRLPVVYLGQLSRNQRATSLGVSVNNSNPNSSRNSNNKEAVYFPASALVHSNRLSNSKSPRRLHNHSDQYLGDPHSRHSSNRNNSSGSPST